MRTVTRSDIAETLYQEVGLSRKDSGEILDMVLEEVTNELVKGNNVKISSFGTSPHLKILIILIHPPRRLTLSRR